MDKVNTFYYNQTFWSSENMCFGKGKKGDLVVQKLTPLYVHASSLSLLATNTSPISKENSKKEEFFNGGLISNDTSTPFN